MQEREGSSSSQHRRSQLPPLAPRRSHTSASNDRTSDPGSGRPPRLSHRSRAGCWTCRARKVKCDETHPKCGPCTRLNRECDWDHRWNFNDATSTTQVKYSNVNTAGNTVWDPQARESPSSSPTPLQQDDLPDFAALTTDDERERKAVTKRPGTYGVVVTPESFTELPEYADSASPSSSRISAISQTNSFASPATSSGKPLTNSRTDPNVVLLERFEDVSLSSPSPLSMASSDRRPSLPNGLQYLSISTATLPGSILSASSLSQAAVRGDEHLVSHFRHYMFSRLVHPQFKDSANRLMNSEARDVFENEATHFEPLHQAICAVSALNLSYNGGSTMEEALQHYHRALSPQTTVSRPDELLSDGAFLRHFLLFIYDICIPMHNEASSAGMWAIHLNHLKRIATLRHERLGREPHAYVLWTLCELDMYACLLGSGNCEFVRTILQNDMLPPLEQQIPLVFSSSHCTYLENEMTSFSAIVNLNQGVLIRTVKLAQVAQSFRLKEAGNGPASPGTRGRWQASVRQLQVELNSFWMQAYPGYLAPASPQAGQALPDRIRYIFEHALVLYHAAMIYSRTSMFPNQRRIPLADLQDQLADTERRVISIISIAAGQLELKQYDRRHVIFPLFMAGFATKLPDNKIQALDIMKHYEGSGIGQNTYQMRQLLAAVYEEQRRVAHLGGRMEDVDWLVVAKERSLTVVNCGL